MRRADLIRGWSIIGVAILGSKVVGKVALATQLLSPAISHDHGTPPSEVSDSLPARYLVALKAKVAHRHQGPLTLADFLPDDDMGRKLQNIFSRYSFSNAPESGEMRQFSDQLISSLIRQARADYPQKVKMFHFNIPAQVEVYNPGESLPEFELRDALLSQWKSQCPLCRFEIQDLVLPRISNREKVSSGWHFSGAPELPRGSFRVAIQLNDQPRSLKRRGTYWVNGIARVLKPVPIATRQLSFNDRLTVEDFKIEYRDVTFSNDATLEASQIQGRQLRLTRGIGQILWEADFKKEKAVLRGEWVRVIAQEGSMEVTTMARAETEGYIGDTIRLQMGPREGNGMAHRQSISGVARARGEVILP